MIRAIAVDDEPEALDILKTHASKLNGIEMVNTFFKPDDAIHFMKNNPIDLLFLDMNMPGISGIELLRKLKVKPLVVFTTAYEQYAVESYKFEAVDYLLKPIDFGDFQAAVNKVQKVVSNNSEKSSENYVFIKDGTKTVKLFFDDILFLKGCGNYVEFITQNGRYSSRMTIIQLLAKLPSHIFIRVHNSYIINIEKIIKIEYNQIIIDEDKITIGESYRDAFNQRIRTKMI